MNDYPPDSERTQDADHADEEHPAMRRQRTDRHLLAGRTLRASEDEWQAWTEEAQLRGLTRQAWARRVLNDALDFVPATLRRSGRSQET